MDPVNDQLSPLEKVMYWEAIVEKLEDEFTHAVTKQGNMFAFLKKFEDDIRIRKLIRIYMKQCKLVETLAEQAELAWDQLLKADLELNVVW